MEPILCFTDYVQTLLDEHAARRRWRGICAWLKRQREAGIRERTAAIDTLAAENRAKKVRMTRLRSTRREARGAGKALWPAR